MVTRNLVCPRCGCGWEATAIGMKEPDRECMGCGDTADVKPSFPCGVKLIGEGFHCNDYPPSAEEKMKQYGLERHNSLDDNSDYHQEGYDGS